MGGGVCVGGGVMKERGRGEGAAASPLARRSSAFDASRRIPERTPHPRRFPAHTPNPIGAWASSAPPLSVPLSLTPSLFLSSPSALTYLSRCLPVSLDLFLY